MNINSFVRKVSEKEGLLDVNRFKVILPFIKGAGLATTEDLQLLCSSVTLPGRQIMTQERRIGIKSEKVADGYAVDDVTLEFYMPADNSIKKYFETWARKTVPNDEGIVNFKVDYQKEVQIHHLKRDGSTSNMCTLRDAFPTTLNSVELSSEATNVLARYNVQLSYTDWIPGDGTAALNIIDMI